MFETNRLRRGRRAKGGACAQAHGLECETALIASPVRRLVDAGLALSSTFFSLMMIAPALAQTDVATPVLLKPLDILWEANGPQTNLVVRMVAPQISRDGGRLDYDAVSGAMDRVCAVVGVPSILNTESQIDRILVIFMDRPVPRGEANPEATQYINIYSVENQRCIWEDF